MRAPPARCIPGSNLVTNGPTQHTLSLFGRDDCDVAHTSRDVYATSGDTVMRRPGSRRRRRYRRAPMITQEALRRIFGFDQFRPGQADAVAAALADRDALVVMPTGSGK